MEEAFAKFGVWDSIAKAADPMAALGKFASDLAFNGEEHAKAHGHEVSFHCDKAYDEAGKALVIMPVTDSPGPHPVMMVLVGNGQVDGRTPLFGAGNCSMEYIVRNEQIRTKFVIVVPLPSTTNGLVRYICDGWQRRWCEDAVWALFTEVLRDLGPEKADPACLYVTGMSMGATAAWNLAAKYGDKLAAVAPVSGRGDWPDDTWPWSSEQPDPAVLERLQNLAIRAYQIDIDYRAGNPLKDMETLGREATLKTRKLKMPGMNMTGDKLDVEAREWRWKPKAPTMELWWVAGPLTDCPLFSQPDNHVLWLRVFSIAQWGLAGFFTRNKVPGDRQWRFDSPPVHVDSSQEKARVEAWFAQWDQAPDEWDPSLKPEQEAGAKQEA